MPEHSSLWRRPIKLAKVGTAFSKGRSETVESEALSDEEHIPGNDRGVAQGRRGKKEKQPEVSLRPSSPPQYGSTQTSGYPSHNNAAYYGNYQAAPEMSTYQTGGSWVASSPRSQTWSGSIPGDNSAPRREDSMSSPSSSVRRDEFERAATWSTSQQPQQPFPHNPVHWPVAGDPGRYQPSGGGQFYPGQQPMQYSNSTNQPYHVMPHPPAFNPPPPQPTWSNICGVHRCYLV